MNTLLAGLGLSTYEDECIDAAHALDARRREHETRHKRFRLQLRPATREFMIEAIKAVGPTELVHHDDLRHVPVRPVAGGVAFAPERMTTDALVDVFEKVRGTTRPDMKVYDRVVEVLATNSSGLRKADFVSIIGVNERSIRRALEALEGESKVRVKLEATRGGGTPRKRYFPVDPPTGLVRLDAALPSGHSTHGVVADPEGLDPAEML